MASSSSSANTSQQSPLPVAKKTFLRRIVPALIAANVAVGAYVLLRTTKKEPHLKDEGAIEEVPSAPAALASVAVPEKTSESPVLPAKALPPIPEEDQRALFKWILEEKRKVKPQNPSEKKKIDEEKALLKELVRAKSIPNLPA
ncbi:hypothetical protein KSP39_PZI012525 [Platanthera zijinensis]|uniref:Transmembrane protein n=1 Tax=Platanthera zijinensis TaxID=2320716 RepID=A0AAP0BHS6_9ASPA